MGSASYDKEEEGKARARPSQHVGTRRKRRGYGECEGEGEGEGEGESEKGRGRGGDLWGRLWGNPRMTAAKMGWTDLGRLHTKTRSNGFAAARFGSHDADRMVDDRENGTWTQFRKPGRVFFFAKTMMSEIPGLGNSLIYR